MLPAGVHVLRGNVVESVHRLHVAVCDANGKLLASHGDPSFVTFWRSAAKPFQALPLVEDGGADKFGLTEAEIALTAASHNGQPKHVETALSILTKADASPANLQCGAHFPYHAATAGAMKARGETPTALHNNCSGKHSGMVALCRFHGWPTDDYLAHASRCQQRILPEIANGLGLPANQIRWAIDGCGVPAWVAPLRTMATAYAKLADARSQPSPRRTALERIAMAMQTNPFMVAGEGRLDTDLMEASRRTLVAKVGGEAVHCTAVPARKFAIAIKVESGETRALGPAVWHVLRSLGVDVADAAAHTAPVIKNVVERDVGRIEAAFDLTMD